MCGNGKSCDECGRGPCGPSSNNIDASAFWKNQGKCPDCRGTGDVGGYREMFSPKRVEWCKIKCESCNGTGKYSMESEDYSKEVVLMRNCASCK